MFEIHATLGSEALPDRLILIQCSAAEMGNLKRLLDVSLREKF